MLNNKVEMMEYVEKAEKENLDKKEITSHLYANLIAVWYDSSGCMLKTESIDYMGIVIANEIFHQLFFEKIAGDRSLKELLELFYKNYDESYNWDLAFISEGVRKNMTLE